MCATARENGVNNKTAASPQAPLCAPHSLQSFNYCGRELKGLWAVYVRIRIRLRLTNTIHDFDRIQPTNAAKMQGSSWNAEWQRSRLRNHIFKCRLHSKICQATQQSHGRLPRSMVRWCQWRQSVASSRLWEICWDPSSCYTGQAKLCAMGDEIHAVVQLRRCFLQALQR